MWDWIDLVVAQKIYHLIGAKLTRQIFAGWNQVRNSSLGGWCDWRFSFFRNDLVDVKLYLSSPWYEISIFPTIIRELYLVSIYCPWCCEGFLYFYNWLFTASSFNSLLHLESGFISSPQDAGSHGSMLIASHKESRGLFRTLSNI